MRRELARDGDRWLLLRETSGEMKEREREKELTSSGKRTTIVPTTYSVLGILRTPDVNDLLPGFRRASEERLFFPRDTSLTLLAIRLPVCHEGGSASSREKGEAKKLWQILRQD